VSARIGGADLLRRAFENTHENFEFGNAACMMIVQFEFNSSSSFKRDVVPLGNCTTAVENILLLSSDRANIFKQRAS
jgi:hypothetical protein